jgi:hypothetical protein
MLDSDEDRVSLTDRLTPRVIPVLTGKKTQQPQRAVWALWRK